MSSDKEVVDCPLDGKCYDSTSQIDNCYNTYCVKTIAAEFIVWFVIIFVIVYILLYALSPQSLMVKNSYRLCKWSVFFVAGVITLLLLFIMWLVTLCY